MLETIYSPRFPRFFAAQSIIQPVFEAVLMLSHWGFALFFITLITGSLLGRATNTPSLLLSALLKNPQESQLHIALAQEIKTQYSLRELKNQELSIANQLLAQTDNSETNVLGASIEQINTLKKEPERQKKLALFWDEVIRTHPHYQDAYLQRILLALDENNTMLAKEYFETAQTLDPNASGVQILERVLQP